MDWYEKGEKAELLVISITCALVGVVSFGCCSCASSFRRCLANAKRLVPMTEKKETMTQIRIEVEMEALDDDNPITG